MEDQTLINCNRLGLIPGPKEELNQFSKRVELCMSLKTSLLKEIQIPNSIPLDSKVDEIVEAALQLAQSIYGIFPSWVPIFFSNWRLTPWHGGAAWIFKLKEDSPLGAILQLRKTFYSKRNYLKIYPREEIIAHEMAHVGRMAFEENKYEELLAYRSSKSFFLRFFGPIVQSAFESRLIISVLFTLFIMDAYFLFQGLLEIYIETQAFKLLPLALMIYAYIRLRKRQSNLKKAEQNLGSISPYAKEILFRLTDREIDTFSKMTRANILEYINREASLRWKTIKLSYSIN